MLIDNNNRSRRETTARKERRKANYATRNASWNRFPLREVSGRSAIAREDYPSIEDVPKAYNKAARISTTESFSSAEEVNSFDGIISRC